MVVVGDDHVTGQGGEHVLDAFDATALSQGRGITVEQSGVVLLDQLLGILDLLSLTTAVLLLAVTTLANRDLQARDGGFTESEGETVVCLGDLSFHGHLSFMRVVDSAHFEDILCVSPVVDTHGSIVFDVGELNGECHVDFIHLDGNVAGLLPLAIFVSDPGHFSIAVGLVSILTRCLHR